MCFADTDRKHNEDMDDAVHEIQPMAFLVSCERNVVSDQEFASQDLSGLGFGVSNENLESTFSML